MWWEPTSENDVRVAAAVNRIEARMREGVSAVSWLPRTAVTGVGSTLIAPGFRLLLLVLDARVCPPLRPDGSPPGWSEGWTVPPRRHRRRLSDLGRAFRFPSRRWRWMPLMELAVLLGILRRVKPQSLDWFDIPADTIVLLTEPPEPLYGTEIRSGRGRGSIGLAVEVERAGAAAARGYTTAGHVIKDPFVRQKRGLGDVFRRSRPPDQVVVAAGSVLEPEDRGYDIAVVASEASLDHSPSLSVNGACDPGDVDADSQPGCTLVGGVSGVRYGYVVAALKLQTGKQGEVWENCWTVVGERGWIGKQGDSGAAVMLQGSTKILGHLVAGIGSEYRGRFELGWVQDLRSQLAFLEHSFGIRLR